jgi:hypothetical protein
VIAVVGITPNVGDHPRLEDRAEQLTIEHLVAKVGVERLDPGVLPGAARLERRRVRRSFGCLCPFCETEDELTADLVRGMGPPTLRVLRPASQLDSEVA